MVSKKEDGFKMVLIESCTVQKFVRNHQKELKSVQLDIIKFGKDGAKSTFSNGKQKKMSSPQSYPDIP